MTLFFCGVCGQIAERSSENKMGTENLTIVFSMTLGVEPDFISAFVRRFDELFTAADAPRLPPTWPDLS